jgi:hypothetical protein
MASVEVTPQQFVDLPRGLFHDKRQTHQTTVAVEEPKDDPLRHYPAKLESLLCWDQTSFANGSLDYVVNLTAAEVESIHAAVASFKGRMYPIQWHSATCGCWPFVVALKLSDIALISPDNFPLPATLAQKLRDVSNTVHNGRGFVVLRGLSARGYSDEDNVTAFAGIGSHIGRDRYTNMNGMAMGKVFPL